MLLVSNLQQNMHQRRIATQIHNNVCVCVFMSVCVGDISVYNLQGYELKLDQKHSLYIVQSMQVMEKFLIKGIENEGDCIGKIDICSAK